MAETWERRAGEGAEAYAAFAVYRDLGPDRTVMEASRQVGKDNRNLHRWVTRYEWYARVLDFDRHNEAIERKAIERERARRAALWERRRLDDLERYHNISIKLADKAAEMIAQPITNENVNTKTGQFELIAAKWTFDTAAKLAKTASDVAAQVVADALADPEMDDFDPATATPEQLREFIARHDLASKARRKAQASGDES